MSANGLHLCNPDSRWMATTFVSSTSSYLLLIMLWYEDNVHIFLFPPYQEKNIIFGSYRAKDVEQMYTPSLQINESIAKTDIDTLRSRFLPLCPVLHNFNLSDLPNLHMNVNKERSNRMQPPLKKWVPGEYVAEVTDNYPLLMHIDQLFGVLCNRRD